ncbi:MAG: hypothetical protein QOG71_2333 [Pyrinomonadaceae bacterium]|nr:hypothetical protein [Pyrinomonadaceae bacterium]
MSRPAEEAKAARLLIALKCSQRIFKYALIPLHFKNFFEYGGLGERIVSHRMQGVDEMVEQFLPASTAGKTNVEVEALRRQYLSGMEDFTRQEVSEYLPILYNQALVMIITVFDGFFSESLTTITNKYPQYLKSMADDKDITIMQIIDLADYSAIFERIQSRVIKRFDYKSITERLDVLRKLGVNVDDALRFKFHRAQTQQKYPESLKLLRSYYEKRNSIVHQEQPAFDTYEQLEAAGEFFSDLVLSLGFALGFKFDVMTDFETMFARHAQRPRT